MKTVLLILAIFSFCSTVALAQEIGQRVDQRQISQRVRIYEGRENREITRREAMSLNTEQRRIRKAERVAEADGRISRRERRRLELSQDRANRRIHSARTNSASR